MKSILLTDLLVKNSDSWPNKDSIHTRPVNPSLVDSAIVAVKSPKKTFSQVVVKLVS